MLKVVIIREGLIVLKGRVIIQAPGGLGSGNWKLIGAKTAGLYFSLCPLFLSDCLILGTAVWGTRILHAYDSHTALDLTCY